MNSINCFLNTEIVNSGMLAGLGDTCLVPVRYFCQGKTVWIRNHHNGPAAITIEHVASYHPGVAHRSPLRKYCDKQAGGFSAQYTSQQKHWLSTMAAIVLLIPGFFLGVLFKGLAYFYSKMRENHRLTIRHFTPHDVIIGSPQQKLQTQTQVDDELDKLIRHPLHQKVNALIIHGESHLKIQQVDDHIQGLNPQKIILVGPQGESLHDPGMPDDYAKLVGCYKPPVQRMNTIAEALAHQREIKPWLYGGKPHKTMYEVTG